MTRQLTFELPLAEARGQGDFFLSPSNQAAYALVEGWRGWPGRKLALAGPEGSGKTHLAHVWAALSGAQIVQAKDLGAICVGDYAGRTVAVEDCETIAGDPAAERALFHLHNLVLAEGGALLFTAKTAPARWGLTLPDLASRLEAATLARLDPPDDMLLAAVLVKLFDDRQLAVQPNLISYLVTRMERSLTRARILVEKLDAQALAENRPVSRSLAARVLDMDGETGA